MKPKTTREKKVLCYSCKTPIHVDRLAGMVMVKKKEAWFCNNIVCLIKFGKLTGELK